MRQIKYIVLFPLFSWLALSAAGGVRVTPSTTRVLNEGIKVTVQDFQHNDKEIRLTYRMTNVSQEPIAVFAPHTTRDFGSWYLRFFFENEDGTREWYSPCPWTADTRCVAFTKRNSKELKAGAHIDQTLTIKVKDLPVDIVKGKKYKLSLIINYDFPIESQFPVVFAPKEKINISVTFVSQATHQANPNAKFAIERISAIDEKECGFYRMAFDSIAAHLECPKELIEVNPIVVTIGMLWDTEDLRNWFPEVDIPGKSSTQKKWLPCLADSNATPDRKLLYELSFSIIKKHILMARIVGHNIGDNIDNAHSLIDDRLYLFLLDKKGIIAKTYYHDL